MLILKNAMKPVGNPRIENDPIENNKKPEFNIQAFLIFRLYNSTDQFI